MPSEIWNRKGAADYVLQPAFVLGKFVLSFTIVRLFCAIFFLLPAYFFIKALSVYTEAVDASPFLLTYDGHRKLARRAEKYRKHEERQAKEQLDGTFRFSKEQLCLPSKHMIRRKAAWYPQFQEFFVCGASVAVVHEMPTQGVKPNGQSVLLLHGNLGWSFIWRHVIPILTNAGYEVFALDWIGHGLSDKPLEPSTANIELHMRTLITFFDQFQPSNCCIAAHDWGAYIATCTAPHLTGLSNPRIFLLNPCFPPRARDMTWNSYSLQLLVFLGTSTFGALVPQSALIRLMAPTSTTTTTIAGYAAPYAASPLAARSSSTRILSLAFFLPQHFRRHIRYTRPWLTFEGLCGPQHFTNLNAQARLAQRDGPVRAFWRTCADEGWKAAIISGRHSSLKEVKSVLEWTIDQRALVKAETDGGWIEGAGHCPAEERPRSVAARICRFLELTG